MAIAVQLNAERVVISVDPIVAALVLAFGALAVVCLAVDALGRRSR